MITKKPKTYIAKFYGITDKMLFNFCPHRTSVAKQVSNGISS